MTLSFTPFSSFSSPLLFVLLLLLLSSSFQVLATPSAGCFSVYDSSDVDGDADETSIQALESAFGTHRIHEKDTSNNDAPLFELHQNVIQDRSSRSRYKSRVRSSNNDSAIDPSSQDVTLGDFRFRDTFLPYPPFHPIRIDPLRARPTTIGNLPVSNMVMSVNGSFRNTMKVWYPTTLRADVESGKSSCRPAVLLLHPVQVFSARGPESEFQQACAHFASLNIICFISLESTGQFGRLTTRKEQHGLATRGLEMWNKVRTESLNPESPFYRGVCNRLGVAGYSMGSGSAALMASKYNDPKHGIKALGYLHGTAISAEVIRSINVPTMIGGGMADMLTNGDRQFRQFNSTMNTKNPLLTVMLQGTPHVTGPCGNQCPMIQTCCMGTYFYGGHLQVVSGQFVSHSRWFFPFMLAYLNEDEEMASLLWEEGIIESEYRVDHVTRNTRIRTQKPTLTATSRVTNNNYTTPNYNKGSFYIPVKAGDKLLLPLMDASVFSNATGSAYNLVLDEVTTLRYGNTYSSSFENACREAISIVPVANPAPKTGDVAEAGSVVVDDVTKSPQHFMLGYDEDELTIPSEEVQMSNTTPVAEGTGVERDIFGRIIDTSASANGLTKKTYPVYSWSKFEPIYAGIHIASCPFPYVNINNSGNANDTGSKKLPSLFCQVSFRLKNGEDNATISNKVTKVIQIEH